MKIALAQMNSLLGDSSFNTEKMIEFITKAHEQSSKLVVFPELNLFGYSPVDLLERTHIISDQHRCINKVLAHIPGSMTVAFGALTKNTNTNGKRFFNTFILAQKNKILAKSHKILLPSYDVFDETRHFESGVSPRIISLGEKNILLTICEDIWAFDNNYYAQNPLLNLKKPVDLILNLSASPFTLNKLDRRKDLFKKVCRGVGAPMVYVNTVGAHDEIIFDGNSVFLNSDGEILDQASGFQEDLLCLEVNDSLTEVIKSTSVLFSDKKKKASAESPEEKLFESLSLGIKDYFLKLGFEKAHLGLSGGVDSALVYALSAQALGYKNVQPLYLPSPFSSDLSHDLAQEMSEFYKAELIEFQISSLFSELNKNWKNAFNSEAQSLTQENFQARLRGLLLMGYANENSSLLMNTSNKSELAVGYSTLYGDQCGALAPIGDLLKHQVYDLCRWINKSKKGFIPEAILTRAPTAELKENQTDQDSLPEYDLLDASVYKIVDQRQAAESETDKWVLNRLYKSEFKRWQSPPILKISDHSFGRGRRFPIVHRLKL